MNPNNYYYFNLTNNYTVIADTTFPGLMGLRYYKFTWMKYIQPLTPVKDPIEMGEFIHMELAKYISEYSSPYDSDKKEANLNSEAYHLIEGEYYEIK